MKVLLTGAFGNVGISALEELLGRGHQVTCLDLKTRSNERAARRYGSRIEIAWADLRSEVDVARAVRGQEVVVHLAFVIPTLSATGLNSEADPARARAINVGGTENLIRAMKAQPTPPRILFSSSLHIYGRTQHLPPPRIVADPPAPIEHYAHHKVECEHLIMSSGLTWAIFRLAAALPIRLILDPAMYEVPLDNRIEFVHTRDVGLAIANALETDETWGRIWLIGGGPRCQIHQRDLTWGVLETIGLGRLPEEAFTDVPYPVDWLDTTESERVLRFQRHTLSDYMQGVRKKLGIGRHLIRLFRPIVRWTVLSQSPVLRERARPRSAVLRGKTAVVVGGSGGIGAATAAELAGAGVRVALIGRSEERLEAVASRLRRDGAECLTLAADLSQESECLRVFQRVQEAFGPADILVNSAGLGWYGFGAEMPWDLAREMIQVNIAAVVRLTLLFLKDMRERNSGHVINVGSVIGALPTQGAALYSATKSFLDSLTSALHRELRGTQVHVSVVRPGPVDTSFYEKASAQPAALPLPGRRFAVSPEAVARRIMRIIRRPRRVAYVPRLLSIVPWLEPSLGWLIDLLGPVLLRWQSKRLSGS